MKMHFFEFFESNHFYWAVTIAGIGWMLYFQQLTLTYRLKKEVAEIKKELRRERRYHLAQREALGEVIKTFSKITKGTEIEYMVTKKVDEIFETARIQASLNDHEDD